MVPRERRTGQRRRLFAGAATLLPLVLVLLLEAGLRLGGFGRTYALFVPDRRASDYLVANHEVVRRFMVGEQVTPALWIRPVPFRRSRSRETYRIFVQGGSTAEGYPYGYGASPAGMLQQRLQRTFPERRVEVVTTAMSAVNSYTLLDFVDEILACEPDAVVVYAGHNEYVGILGVGSTFSAGRFRPLILAFLALDELRLLQLGRRAVGALTARDAAPTRRTLMERIVAEDRIPYGSSLYQRGLEQYRANLRALLRRYRRAGVPVLVGTLVSNERDQPPFLAGFAKGANREAWRRHFDFGRSALAAGAPQRALEAFERAVAADPLNAEGHFDRGRALERLGRFAEARQAYLAAKDRDELRFRAPEAINDIVRATAAAEGAWVVDVQEAFHRAAPNGIVGSALMLEHLHPNLEGYFVLADAYYRAFRDRGLIGGWERPVSRGEARRELPVTEVDRLYGEYRIRQLTARWPFSDADERFRPPHPEQAVEKIAQGLYRGTFSWSEAMRRLLDYYRSRGATAEAARVAALLADAFPYLPDDQLAAAELLRRAGHPSAEIYERRARP